MTSTTAACVLGASGHFVSYPNPPLGFSTLARSSTPGSVHTRRFTSVAAQTTFGSDALCCPASIRQPLTPRKDSIGINAVTRSQCFIRPPQGLPRHLQVSCGGVDTGRRLKECRDDGRETVVPPVQRISSCAATQIKTDTLISCRLVQSSSRGAECNGTYNNSCHKARASECFQQPKPWHHRKVAISQRPEGTRRSMAASTHLRSATLNLGSSGGDLGWSQQTTAHESVARLFGQRVGRRQEGQPVRLASRQEGLSAGHRVIQDANSRIQDGQVLPVHSFPGMASVHQSLTSKDCSNRISPGIGSRSRGRGTPVVYQSSTSKSNSSHTSGASSSRDIPRGPGTRTSMPLVYQRQRRGRQRQWAVGASGPIRNQDSSTCSPPPPALLFSPLQCFSQRQGLGRSQVLSPSRSTLSSFYQRDVNQGVTPERFRRTLVRMGWWDGLWGRRQKEPPEEWVEWEEGDDDAYREESSTNGGERRRPKKEKKYYGGPFDDDEEEDQGPSKGGNGRFGGNVSDEEDGGGGSGEGALGGEKRRRRDSTGRLSRWEQSSLVGGPFDDIDGVINNPEEFRAWRNFREARESAELFNETGRGAPDDDEPWEDWLDDVEDYKDFSSWYEEQEDPWEKDGMPRAPPKMPERGLSRTFTELLPLIFLPQDAVEEELTFEEKVFRFTSQATARFLVVLLVVPWIGSWIAHDCIFVPFTERYVETTPLVAEMLDLRESQKLQLIQQLKLERQRIRFESEIGKAPPISEEQLAAYLQEEAHHLRDEIREENQQAFAYIFSDAIGLGLFGGVLYLNPRSVSIMRLTGSRIFTNISDTGKAFVIILLSDIFLGYHSQSGWETVIEMFLDHYGLEADTNGIYIFIATVPVTLDCFFKLWIFRSLTRLSPSTAATLREMQRH